jgi:hypothetical protein
METPASPQERTDNLSILAYDVLQLDAASAYRALVVKGEGNPRAKALLAPVTPGQLLMKPPARPEEAEGLLAGLWLWHDWLEPSHTIAQGIASATGSFWHAILHRREGDFSNSKYWYARAKGHPMMPVLSGRASALLNPLPADKSLLRLVYNGWSPEAFVDLVQAIHQDPNDPRYGTVVALQQLEWRVLFEHGAREAV